MFNLFHIYDIVIYFGQYITLSLYKLRIVSTAACIRIFGNTSQLYAVIFSKKYYITHNNIYNISLEIFMCAPKNSYLSKKNRIHSVGRINLSFFENVFCSRKQIRVASSQASYLKFRFSR